MASKLPTASSSEEDETSSEEEEIPSEEEETSSDDDNNDEPSKPQSEKSKSKDSLAASTSTIPSKPQSRASSFDSESDTVEDPKRIKPIDEIEETSKFKKPTMKRSHDGAVSDSKRGKKGAKEDVAAALPAEDSKKLFQNLFSDDDAIAVLNGMLEFKRKTGAIPQKKDLNAFHDSIKEALHADVSNRQLYDKIQKLKSKYKKIKKRKYNPSEPHEKKYYELSKKVWPEEEEENGGTEMPKPQRKNQKSKLEKARNNAVGTSFMSLAETSPGLSLFDGETLRKRFELIEGPKRSELEDQWKKLQIAELELFVSQAELEKNLAELKKNQAELKKNQAALILEAYKSSG